MRKEEKADLHVHSHYSDGLHSPKDIVKLAKKRGIKVLALTDHNSVAGVEEAIREGKRSGVKVIPAVEIYVNGGEIVGYFIECKNRKLLSTLKKNSKIIQDLKIKPIIKKFQKFGIKISYKDLIKMFPKAKGNYLGLHIDLFLISKGYKVKEIEELFERAQVHSTKGKEISAIKAIKLIKACGGVAMFPHPWLSEKLFSEKKIKEFVKAGLKGIEFDNGDRNTFGRTKKVVSKIKKFAKKYNLILTKGSDFHDSPYMKMAPHQLGGTTCSLRVVEKLNQASEK